MFISNIKWILLYCSILKIVPLDFLHFLYRSVQDAKMEAFFNLDFNNDNNRRVAMKNAFHLLSKGQYHHAAALFFLADQVDNAVNVSLPNSCIITLFQKCATESKVQVETSVGILIVHFINC